MIDAATAKPMTFEVQTAKLYRLEAVALSLGISSEAFERIAMEVTAQAQIDDASPEEPALWSKCTKMRPR